MTTHAAYLSQLTPQNFGATVDWCRRTIAREYPTANLVLARGLSGSMIAPALAFAANLQWAIVRKNDTSHSCNKIEVSEWPQAARVVFVDDLISSGETVKTALDALFAEHARYDKQQARWDDTYIPKTLQVLGAVLYDYRETRTLTEYLPTNCEQAGAPQACRETDTNLDPDPDLSIQTSPDF